MPRKLRGFSLLELVVAIVVIGFFAAIVAPRVTRGASRASLSVLKTNLSTVRQAIQRYAREHGGAFPGPDAAGFVLQLTSFTDLDGRASASRTAVHVYGPYLQSIPPCPVGENAGNAAADAMLIVHSSPPAPNAASGEGWIYNPATGEFHANTALRDEAAKRYCGY